MNLRIKSAFYDAISANEVYPVWTIAFHLPPNLMTNMHQIETVVSLRKTQAKDMLKTLSLMSSEEANNCKERADAATQAIKAYYQQPGASNYNLDEALNALLTLTERSQKIVHAEQQKKFLELSQKPTLALYSGCLIVFYQKISKIKGFSLFNYPHGGGVNPDPPLGGNQSIWKNQGDPLRAQRLLSPRRKSGPENQKDTGAIESLEFFYQLCNIETNLLNIFNKLNDTNYVNGIVNLSKHTLTK